MSKVKPNFKCSKTGREFFIPKYRSKIVNGELQHFDDKWNRLVNDFNGEPLDKITPDEIQLTSIKTDTASR